MGALARGAAAEAYGFVAYASTPAVMPSQSQLQRRLGQVLKKKCCEPRQLLEPGGHM